MSLAPYNEGDGPDAEDRLVARWERDIEDLESEDWEYHMGGAEDELLEPLDSEEEDDLAEYEQEEKGREDDHENELEPETEDGGIWIMRTASDRQTRILEWLKQSELVTQATEDGDGFEVGDQCLVRLKDDKIVRATPWLVHEGFEDGLVVGEYLIAQKTEESGQDIDAIVFHKKQVVDAPFDLDAPSSEVKGGDDDDIPF